MSARWRSSPVNCLASPWALARAISASRRQARAAHGSSDSHALAAKAGGAAKPTMATITTRTVQRQLLIVPLGDTQAAIILAGKCLFVRYGQTWQPGPIVAYRLPFAMK